MECFVGYGCNFEFNTLFDRKPVKFGKGWRNVVTASDRWDDNSSKGVLDELEAVYGSIREVIEKGVAEMLQI